MGAGAGMSPGAAGASMGSPGMAPGAAGASMSPGGASLGGMGGMGGPPGSGRLGSASSSSENYDTAIEIFGLVYLFNPPNEAKLGGLGKGQTAGAPVASPNQSSSVTVPAIQPAS
jgi:hypothetical protein